MNLGAFVLVLGPHILAYLRRRIRRGVRKVEAERMSPSVAHSGPVLQSGREGQEALLIGWLPLPGVL